MLTSGVKDLGSLDPRDRRIAERPVSSSALERSSRFRFGCFPGRALDGDDRVLGSAVDGLQTNLLCGRRHVDNHHVSYWPLRCLHRLQ